MTFLINAAKNYLEAGLSVFAVGKNKKPSVMSWALYQKRRPTPEEIETMFADAGAKGVAVVCGEISGGLECLDFDDGGSCFDSWKQKIPLKLYNSLTIERSPSGGYHAYYRCRITEGRTVFYRYEGKMKITLIEVRGNGHYTVMAPTPRYELEQGSFYSIPEITPKERNILIDAARSFDEIPPKSLSKQTTTSPLKAQSKTATAADLRPGDDYNQQATMGSMRELLENNGWTFHHEDAERIHFTRPGKNPSEGESGNLMLQNGIPIFFNHSSNVPDVPSDQGLSPFTLYCHLEHNGDEKAAASALRRSGYGGNRKDGNLVSSPAIPADNISNADDDVLSIHRDPETYTDFPTERLPRVYRQWVRQKAKAMNVDEGFLAMSILGVSSGLIGAKYVLNLEDGWKTYPVLWVFLVGHSSAKKSPVMDECLKFLADREAELAAENADAYARYEVEKRNFEATLTRQRRKGDINFDELPEKPIEPPEKVLVVSGDYTMNGLIKCAANNKYGFILYADEISMILKAQDSTKKGEPMLGELAKFYTGRPSRTMFKNRDVNVYAERCLAAVICGGTTGNVRNLIANTENATNGFTSRLIMHYPPMPKQYEKNASVDSDTAKNMKAVIEYLIDLKPDKYQVNKEGVLGEPMTVYKDCPNEICLKPLFKDTSDTWEHWQKWREDIFNRVKTSNDELEISLLGKSEELLARIALLLNILKGADEWIQDKVAAKEKSENDDMFEYIQGTVIPETIPLETWKDAETITTWVIDECRAVHQILGLSATRNSDKDVLAAIEKLVEGMQKKGVPEISSSHIGDYVSQARGKNAKAKDLINRIVAYAAKDKRFSIRQGEYNGRPVQYLKLVDK